MEGWIKIHRKIEKWEWYQDSKMVHLFIHFLFKANHEPKKWIGVKIKRGQFVTGRKNLSIETGISEQSIRTCLERLKASNEITIKTTKMYSIITITNYDTYQINKSISTNKTTNDQPTINQRSTTTKNIKNYKEYYNDQISKAKDEKYELFVKFLFETNTTGEPLNQVLSIQNQISYNSFLNLMKDFPKDNIKTTIEAMDSKNLSQYNYVSFAGALRIWLKK